MKEVKQFIERIKKGKDYQLGSPWKYSDKSKGVIVPILLKKEIERNYITYPEVKDDVKITDTGVVSVIQVENNLDKPLFIRTGTLFEGLSSQDRALISSIVVEPKINQEINVRCVHASRPTARGSGFKYSGFAPRNVHQSLYVGQTATWNSVRSYGLKQQKIGHFEQDDLPAIKKKQMDLDKNIQNILKEVPVLENQVGAIIVGMDGIVGLETFDHPDSWKAQYKEAISNYSDELAEKAEKSLFTFDESNLNKAIDDFLVEIETAVFDTINETSYYVQFPYYIGEVAIFKGKVIHLFVMRKDNKETDEVEQRKSYCVGLSDRDINLDLFAQRTMKKGFNEVIQAIEKQGGQATWGEIEKNLSSSKISTATISKRLKDGKEVGLFKERLRKANGKKVYSLGSSENE